MGGSGQKSLAHGRAGLECHGQPRDPAPLIFGGPIGAGWFGAGCPKAPPHPVYKALREGMAFQQLLNAYMLESIDVYGTWLIALHIVYIYQSI